MASAVRHFVAAAAVLAAVAYLSLYGPLYSPDRIQSDGYSYYVYLPSVLIYHDPSLAALANDWYGGSYPDFTGIRRWPATGRWIDVHPIGTAILMAPFVVAADALTVWSNLPRDGFSLYYQHGAALAAIACFLLGLAILRQQLRRDFSDGVVLATLVCVTWGTNLFHYAVFDGTFSHSYAFFVVCLWLWVVDRWWERPALAWSLAVGAVAALNVLIRHSNLIFALVLPLYGITHWRDLRPRAIALAARWRPLSVAAAAGLVVLMPQLALYKAQTGVWLANAYTPLGMTFSFGSPHLLAVLFGTEKGLFFWSPVLLLAGAGVFAASSRARALVCSAVVIFAVQTYLIASWGDWQFGGSFGHRGFTDGLALAAPFIASSFAWATRHRRWLPAVAVFASAAVFLSAAQMLQYWTGVLPQAGTTWAQYRDLFLRFR